ncbi:MAG: nuclear transport factor 2 family protein [Acidobacteriota bacterium]
MTVANRVTPAVIERQEERFARAFAAADLEIARPLYHPEVVYLSPTVRLFGWPPRIQGVDRTLEFIGRTIQGIHDIAYRAVETAITPTGSGAFVRIHFDWTMAGQRLRCNYVVIYRYRDERIAQQELYYDPDARLEVLSGASESRRAREGR